MKSIWRKLRAAMGIGLAWASGWAAAVFSLGIFAFLVGGGVAGGNFWPGLIGAAFQAGLLGFISGATFAGLLGLVHRRSTLGDLKPGRTGLLGVIAGLVVSSAVVGIAVTAGVVPMSTQLIGSMAVVYGGLGMASAASTIFIAKGPRDRRPSAGALREARMRGQLACPVCGCLFGEDDETCQNYPRGALRGPCGFERSEAQRAFPLEEAGLKQISLP
jgi:hypothetical protein